MGKVDNPGSEQPDRPETAVPARFTAGSLGAFLDVLRILHAQDQAWAEAESRNAAGAAAPPEMGDRCPGGRGGQ